MQSFLSRRNDFSLTNLFLFVCLQHGWARRHKNSVHLGRNFQIPCRRNPCQSHIKAPSMNTTRTQTHLLKKSICRVPRRLTLVLIMSRAGISYFNQSRWLQPHSLLIPSCDHIYFSLPVFFTNLILFSLLAHSNVGPTTKMSGVSTANSDFTKKVSLSLFYLLP